MEQMTLTPSRRLEARRAYGRTVDAFDTVAWRPPGTARFDGRVANDATVEPQPIFGDMADSVPAWLPVAVGGVVAALLGAFFGGALSI